MCRLEFVLVPALTCILAASLRSQSTTPELLFVNARVYTVDPAFSMMEAVAIAVFRPLTLCLIFGVQSRLERFVGKEALQAEGSTLASPSDSSIWAERRSRADFVSP